MLANPETVVSGMAVNDWLLKRRLLLGAFEMILFAALCNCIIYAFEGFDEGVFLRWQRKHKSK